MVDGDVGLAVLSALGSFRSLLGCVEEGGVLDDRVDGEVPVVGSCVDNVESVAVPAGAVVVDCDGELVVDWASAAPGKASAAAAIRPKVFILLSYGNSETCKSKMHGSEKGSPGRLQSGSFRLKITIRKKAALRSAVHPHCAR